MPTPDVAHAWHVSYLWMVGNMAVALLLGWLVGYERYFKGRAAGSQVYCLVCVTSCAVTLLAGFPALWYWGHATQSIDADPTKVIGSILTGIGFLGARIIVKSGLNVRGLTTAASIWGSSVIGILVGAGFLPAAIGLTALFVACTAIVPWIEHRLPACAAITASLKFREGYRPSVQDIHSFVAERGLTIPPESVSIEYEGKRFELECLILTSPGVRTSAMSRIAADLAKLDDVESFTVAHSSRA
jgi:putative Mg2+ transporter-C (MgtC) family protein